MNFPYYKQHDSMDCGPTCLRMIAKYYGKSLSLQYLRQKCQIQRNGVSLLGISEAGESIGFKTLAAKLDYDALSKEAVLPCIVHWNQNHFVVVYKISKSYAWLADPGKGIVKLGRKDFEHKWISARRNEESLGIALLLEPAAAFNTSDDEGNKKNELNAAHLFNHFKKHKRLFVQLALGILIGII